MYLQVLPQEGLDLGRKLGRGIELQHVPGFLNIHGRVTRAVCPGIDAQVSRKIALAARHQQHVSGYCPPACLGLGPLVEDRIR